MKQELQKSAGMELLRAAPHYHLHKDKGVDRATESIAVVAECTKLQSEHLNWIYCANVICIDNLWFSEFCKTKQFV